MANFIRKYEPSRDVDKSWEPSEGDRFLRLMSKFDEIRAQKSRDEALRVVQKCINPTFEGEQRTTQLVLGQVQSGKTSNMANTIGLAADNGFSLIIVLTGTKRILDSQTVRDLKRTLSEPGGGGRAWFNFREVGPDHDEFKSAANATPILEIANDWHSGSNWSIEGMTDGYPLVVFLLKNAQNIKTFIESMAQVPAYLRTMPTLIIDDEADQAGPDAGKPDAPSITNVRIQELRELFSRQSYLLYTATPQAPLLSHLGNALSPESVTNLEPGADYVGISDLFPASSEANSPARFVKQINLADVAVFKRSKIDVVPESLHEALAYFFVYGAVARTQPYNLDFVTMMIHSSAEVKPMEDTQVWVTGIIAQWKLLFDKVDDPDFEHEWTRLFQPALDELSGDVERLSRHGVCLEKDVVVQGIRKLLARNNVRVLNQKTANLLDDQWTGTFAWILIGGEKLSRGFRVENLLITYMPRDKSKSDSALDTVQQRGRFFGYRRRYIELLKGWLPVGIAEAFATYRDHDNQLRSILKQLEQDNLPLKSWKRILLTNPGFVPTRRSVIKLDVGRASFTPGDVAFSQMRLYVPGVAQKTFPQLLNLIETCKLHGLVPAEKFGEGDQLKRAFGATITISEMLEFLLSYYEALSGPDSYLLSDLLDFIGQGDDDSLKSRECLVIFHESRELGATEFDFKPDKRGPAGGTSGKFNPLGVGENSAISGLSRSNAAGQIAKIDSQISHKNFVIHVYLFDVYISAITPGIDQSQLFSANTPAIQIRIPGLPLMSAVKQSK